MSAFMWGTVSWVWMKTAFSQWAILDPPCLLNWPKSPHRLGLIPIGANTVWWEIKGCPNIKKNSMLYASQIIHCCKLGSLLLSFTSWNEEHDEVLLEIIIVKTHILSKYKEVYGLCRTINPLLQVGELFRCHLWSTTVSLWNFVIPNICYSI